MVKGCVVLSLRGLVVALTCNKKGSGLDLRRWFSMLNSVHKLLSYFRFPLPSRGLNDDGLVEKEGEMQGGGMERLGLAGCSLFLIHFSRVRFSSWFFLAMLFYLPSSHAPSCPLRECVFRCGLVVAGRWRLAAL